MGDFLVIFGTIFIVTAYQLMKHYRAKAKSKQTLLRAQGFETQGDWQSAIALYKRAALTYPGLPNAQMLKEAYLRAGIEADLLPLIECGKVLKDIVESRISTSERNRLINEAVKKYKLLIASLPDK